MAAPVRDRDRPGSPLQGGLRWIAPPLAIAMIIGLTALGGITTSQTVALDAKLAIISDTVDANLRVPAQTQRELLLLRTELLREPLDLAEVELRRAFLSQRMFEITRDVQRAAMVEPALYATGVAISDRWFATLQPQVVDLLETGASSAPPALLEALSTTELEINRLVADVEGARRRQAASVRDDATMLIARTELLLAGIGLTLVLLLGLLAIAIIVWRRVDRSREADAQELAALNAELVQLSEVAARTDNPVIITDGQGLTRWVNDAFTRVTGYTLGALEGRTPGSVLQGPETDPATVARMRDAIAAGRPVEVEVLNYRASGEARWLHMAISPVHNRETGELTNFIAVQRDVTERREFEAELIQAKQAAEETADAKAAFLASMSHEIRTPLNAVVGATELLIGTDLDERQSRFAHVAQDSSRLLLALIDNILSYSALGSSPLQFDDRPVDVAGMLHNIGRMFQPVATKRGVTFEVEVDPRLPALLLTDETRLRQVLHNLITNAVKFTAEGSVRLAAQVIPSDRSTNGADPGRCTVRFEVSDTGIGIQPDRIERLFEPFTQEDATVHRRFGGTGLGLAICRRIVDAMGGDIAVTAIPEVGSSFAVTLTLPTVSPADQPARPDEPVRWGGAKLGQPDGPGIDRAAIGTLRVLAVEDDPMNLLILTEFLAKVDCQPTVTESAEEALELLRCEPFDVVLTDIQLPGMDGEALLRVLRDELPPEQMPRLVALTANALPGDRERFLAAGFNDYLSKPLSFDALLSVLDRANRAGPAAPSPSYRH
jgi:PAS domain S-box-containing protein